MVLKANWRDGGEGQEQLRGRVTLDSSRVSHGRTPRSAVLIASLKLLRPLHRALAKARRKTLGIQRRDSDAQTQCMSSKEELYVIDGINIGPESCSLINRIITALRRLGGLRRPQWLDYKLILIGRHLKILV
jgi:hypothetical protein